MAVVNAKYKQGQTDLSLAGTFDVGAAPSTWSANSTLVLAAGYPVSLTNLNALAGVNFNSVKVQPGYRGDFGTAADPIQIDCDGAASKLLDYNGSGPGAYVTGGSTDTIGHIWWRPTNGSLLTLVGAVICSVRLFAESGAVKATSAQTVVDVWAGSGSQIDVDMHASDVGAVLVVAPGSAVTVKRNFSGRVTVMGTLTIDLSLDTAGVIAADNFTGEIVMAGGTLRHVNGNLASVTGYAGLIDQSGLELAATMTLTASRDLRIKKSPLCTITETVVGEGSRRV